MREREMREMDITEMKEITVQEKEVTVQEFVKAVSGGVYNIESTDTYGIQVHMANATILYEADFDELIFKVGLDEISFNVIDCIESITVDENETYTIEFMDFMSNILVTATNTNRKVAS